MNLDFNSDKPIFLQISEGLADDILSGIFPEESQIPSITEFSLTYKINPATALKGINQLVDRIDAALPRPGRKPFPCLAHFLYLLFAHTPRRRGPFSFLYRPGGGH